MKRHIGLISVLTVLAAVLFLPVLISCNDRGTQLRQALAAADSLMKTDPQAALDTLLTIDSTDAAGLPRADRALYTLLRTEAGYKCWLPVAGNTTAISEAVDYYRRKGPEDRLARALTMQGAVLTECGDPDGAMLAYKEAEPLLERSGDLEQLGLLHTRIGELYQMSSFNDSAAIARYRKALNCFKDAELPERIMYAESSLARMLVLDSSDKAVPHILEALRLADIYGNRLCSLSCLEMILQIKSERQDYDGVIRTVSAAHSKYSWEPQITAEKELYRNILATVAYSYLKIGHADSAGLIAATIQPVSPPDSLLLYDLYAQIANQTGDWKTLAKCRTAVMRLTLDAMKIDKEARITEIERKYDNAVLREELYRHKARVSKITAASITAAVLLSLIIFALFRLTKQLKAERNILKKRLSSQISESENSRTELQNLLLQQASANLELMKYYNRTHDAMMEIVSTYTVYKDNPNRHLFADKAFKTAQNFTEGLSSITSATRLLNTAYPGFLETLFKDFPDLKHEDKAIIILTCCGCPNHVVCSFLNISETNLSTKKTRISKRMSIDESLSKFLKARILSYKSDVLKQIENFSQCK